MQDQAPHLMTGKMRIIYVLLSPTFGMHQYTADLANRMSSAGHEVHLVTTSHVPRDRYGADIAIHTPVATTDRGFSIQGARLWELSPVIRTVLGLQPDLVHITGPHLWSPLLMNAMRRGGVPTVHTLHDLHPHAGAVYGRLLYLWNNWVCRVADHILLHGACFRAELVSQGVLSSSRVTHIPLAHLFVGHDRERRLVESPPVVEYEPWALFLGRVEVYKGLSVLMEAARLNGRAGSEPIQVVVAGPGRPDQLIKKPLPRNVDLRNHLIGDEEAVDLFSRCGLVALPYVEASQSALVAAAYFFRKPVVVTRVGALPEYVVEGETGWVIPPNDPQALAETMRAALSDPDRLRRMGEAGRRWYERQRQSEALTLRSMYDQVANSR